MILVDLCSVIIAAFLFIVVSIVIMLCIWWAR